VQAACAGAAVTYAIRLQHSIVANTSAHGVVSAHRAHFDPTIRPREEAGPRILSGPLRLES
jgi:hypothetical protein